MKKLLIMCLAFFPAGFLMGQANNAINKGNEAYKIKEYSKAADYYRKALEQSPSNTVAAFNLGNTMFRDSMHQKAMEHFDAVGKSTAVATTRGDAFYNKGVVLTGQKKLPESIKAYKDALRLNPADTLAKQNLQRALNELKNQQQQQDNRKDQQPETRSDKLNKQQVAQMLQALQEQEKLLQQKLNKSKVPAPVQPGKDW
jgi:Ca-activated chloride channel family protein